jgi:hypothetical protein
MIAVSLLLCAHLMISAAGLPPLQLEEAVVEYTLTDRVFMLTFSTFGLALMGWVLKVTAQTYLGLAVQLAAAVAAEAPWLYSVSSSNAADGLCIQVHIVW